MRLRKPMPKAKELQELDDWKVGQEVYIEKDTFGMIRRICKINRITDGRNGTIYASDFSFDKHGEERGSSYHRAKMTPATDQHRLRIRGANARRRLQNVEWNTLSDEEAIRIEKLLNENGVKTK
jgi:hypothetical protein